MSSRSFRKRNNRRKHARGGTDAPRQVPGANGSAGGERAAGPGPEGAPGGQQGNPPRGHRRHPGSRRGAEERSPEAQRRASDFLPRAEPLVFPDCPICRQPVRELASALTHRETGQPAHFDCIMRELRDSNELTPQERICYLGGGSFGILEFRQPAAAGRFVIRKRIQYEEKEAVPEWKKPLLISV